MYKWHKEYIYVVIHAMVFVIEALLIVIHEATEENNHTAKHVIFCYAVFILLLEFIQIVNRFTFKYRVECRYNNEERVLFNLYNAFKQYFFVDLVNIVDLFAQSGLAAWCLMSDRHDESEPDGHHTKSVTELNYLYMFVILLIVQRACKSFLSLFDGPRYMITMVSECILEMIPFLTVVCAEMLIMAAGFF